MDLKVNQVNFQGKREIMYGLTKAADNVHSYSVYQQPRLLKLGENKNAEKYEVAAKAYLDMVVNDREFESFVTYTDKKKLQNIFKQYLTPLEDGIKPLEFFGTFLRDVMSKNLMFNQSIRDAEKYLIKRLSEL